MRSHFRLLFAGTLFSGVILAQTASPVPVPPPMLPDMSTAMAGLATGQTARLTVVNIAPLTPAEAPVLPCTAQLSFLDTNGSKLKTVSVTVSPGQAQSLDLNHDTDLSSPPARIELRGLISRGANTPSPAVAAPFTCNLFASLEIFDTATGATRVLTTGVRSGLVAIPVFPTGAFTFTGRRQN
ncbi:MAG TPA: hypothetical protein VFW83_11075 [Bryobacteraceae bacterium]|nr:hypothetical protein [Bryobacteraceae bacterium]